MTKNQIIAELYTSPQMDQMLAKFNAGAGQEDLKAELFAVLCERPEDKIVEMHSNGQLMYFATGIVQKMIFQKGKFWRTFRQHIYEHNDAMLHEPDDMSAKDREHLLNEMDKAIDSLDLAERLFIEVWKREQSLVQISNNTGINYKEIRRIYSNSKRKLMSELTGKLYGNYVVASMDIVIDCHDNITPENIIELLDNTLTYFKRMVEGKEIRTDSIEKSFIKEIKPIKVKKIV